MRFRSPWKILVDAVSRGFKKCSSGWVPTHLQSRTSTTTRRGGLFSGVSKSDPTHARRASVVEHVGTHFFQLSTCVLTPLSVAFSQEWRINWRASLPEKMQVVVFEKLVGGVCHPQSVRLCG